MTRIIPSVMLALLAVLNDPAGADAPRRVVSFNLCADQLVLALADREQIAGLSPYAADPMLSVVADAARDFRRLDWQAETTLTLKPDLVLVGPNDRSITRRMLTALGMRVEEVGFVRDLDSARRQIAEVAALLGHPERGVQLIADLDAARARLARLPRLPYRTALVVERGGYIQGPSSLAAALLEQAGLDPPSGAPAGYGGFIPLEQLIVLKPDLIFLKDPPRVPDDQGSLYFLHPALDALYPPQRRIALPERYTMCGGPALQAAFDYLADTLLPR
jgi:iron complex transport system substrate-binding protein